MRLSFYHITPQMKRLGIRLSRNEKVGYLLFAEHNNNLIFELWERLIKICIMDNFDELYQP